MRKFGLNIYHYEDSPQSIIDFVSNPPASLVVDDFLASERDPDRLNKGLEWLRNIIHEMEANNGT